MGVSKTNCLAESKIRSKIDDLTASSRGVFLESVGIASSRSLKMLSLPRSQRTLLTPTPIYSKSATLKLLSASDLIIGLRYISPPAHPLRIKRRFDRSEKETRKY